MEARVLPEQEFIMDRVRRFCLQWTTDNNSFVTTSGFSRYTSCPKCYRSVFYSSLTISHSRQSKEGTLVHILYLGVFGYFVFRIVMENQTDITFCTFYEVKYMCFVRSNPKYIIPLYVLTEDKDGYLILIPFQINMSI